MIGLDVLFCATIILLALQAGFPQVGRVWGIIWGLYFSICLTALFA